MTVFSPGQAARLRLMVTTYKPTLCANMPSGSCDGSGGAGGAGEPPAPTQAPVPVPTPPPALTFLS